MAPAGFIDLCKGMTSVFKVKKNVVVGVDIGSAFIKAVQAKKTSSGYSIVSAGISPIAENTIEDAKEKEKNVLESVTRCLDSVQAQTVHAVTGISGPEVAVRTFRFPNLSKDELKNAALLEASQVCPFNVEDAAVDYQVLAHDENGYAGILVAATHQAVDEKARLIRHSSLNPVLMDIDGLAILNCFTQGLPYKGKPVALVNVGAYSTNVVIVDQDGLPIVRDIAIGGETILDRLCSGSGERREDIFEKIFAPLESQDLESISPMPAPQIETVNEYELSVSDDSEELEDAVEDAQEQTPQDLMFALADDQQPESSKPSQPKDIDEDDDEAYLQFQTIEPPTEPPAPIESEPVAGGDFQSNLARACSGLFSEINNTIRYYGSSEISSEIEEVHVTGGFSQSPGFASLAVDQITSDVSLWDPTREYKWEGSKEAKKTLEKYRSCFAVAIGLALRTF